MNKLRDIENKNIILISDIDDEVAFDIALEYSSNENNILILLSKDEKKLKDLDDKISINSNQKPFIVQIDVTDHLVIERLANEIETRYGKLDRLIRVSSYSTKPSMLVDYEIKDWLDVVGHNLNACFYFIRYFTPLLLNSSNPEVTFIGSELSKEPKNFLAPFIASENATIMLLNNYKKEMNNKNIRVDFVRLPITKNSLSQVIFPDNSHLEKFSVNKILLP